MPLSDESERLLAEVHGTTMALTVFPARLAAIENAARADAEPLRARVAALEGALADVLILGHIQDDGPSLCQCRIHQNARRALAQPPVVTATGADVEHRLAPWTEDEVAALVRRQGDGNFHPYTCGVGTGGHPPLVPSREGWVCLACDYRQAWAHTADTITPPAIPPTSDGAVEGPWCRWTDGTHGCVAPESDVCHRRGHVEYRHDWRPIPAPDASVEP